MIYIIPGLGDKKYNLPKYVKYLNLSIDDVLNLPKLPKDSVLIGFSVGAIVAYLIALKNPVKKLVLCSPSPVITRYRTPKAKIYVLSGKKEISVMRNYAKKIASKLNAEFVEVNSGHKITKPYKEKILQVLLEKL